MPVDRERVARAILDRRTKPDFAGADAIVSGSWRVDHDLELADAAIRAVIEGLMEPSEEAMNAWAALAVERIKRHATGNPDGLTPEEGAAQCFRAMLRAELRRLKGEKE